MSLYLHHAGEGPETVRLERWTIREFEGGARHLVGYCTENCDGRVSTAVVELDPLTRTARTASGRRYELWGKPGYCADAEYVWNRVHKTMGNGAEWRDVTEEVILDARSRTQTKSAS